MPYTGNAKDCRHPHIFRFLHNKRDLTPGGGGTWVFFGWVCAARDSNLAPRSRKNFP